MKATPEQIQAVIKYQYWLFNHGDPKNILVEVFGEDLGLHFTSKLEGFFIKCGQTAFAWTKLFMEMTDHNQQALVEWVLNHYEG